MFLELGGYGYTIIARQAISIRVFCFHRVINDIVKEIHSNIRLSADDTSLYIIVDFPDSAAQILNLDLERLYNWAVQWLVKFNLIKTKSLLFSRRVNLRDHPTLFLMMFQYKKLYLINIKECVFISTLRLAKTY